MKLRASISAKNSAGFDSRSGDDQFVEPAGNFDAGDPGHISVAEVAWGGVVSRRAGSQDHADRRN